MKLVKSLLLGSAAGIAAVAGAQAADLPSRKAAPVEYVRVCSAFGTGFFYIPGTDTCLRVSGRVRAEYLVQQRFNNAGIAGGATDVADAYGFRARSHINLDARNQTAYGTLRTFIRLETTFSNGSYNQGVNGTGPQFVSSRGAWGNVAGSGNANNNLAAAFIQFGPITAGRAQSFFDFYADSLNYGPIRGSDMVLNLLAYTATFGSGFSATISLEDRAERQVVGPATLAGLSAGYGYVSGGSDYPDVVGSLNLTQGWGAVQLSGALFQRNTQGVLGVQTSSDKTGFAVQGGVKINLPMLAAGDLLYLQAAYAEGGITYLGYGGNGPSSTWGPNSSVGRILLANSDAAVDVNGSVKLTKGYAVTAGFLHYWTPTIRQAVYGSYSKLDYGNNIGALGAVGLDPVEWRAGSNLIWEPVAGLNIGVEVLYARVEVKAPVQAMGRPVGIFTKSEDAWQGRLRVQRDF